MGRVCRSNIGEQRDNSLLSFFASAIYAENMQFTKKMHG